MILTLWLACSGPEEVAVTSAPAEEGVADVDALRALGYLDAAEVDEGARSGLLFIDEARSQPGYNLFLSRNLHRADLVDAQGRVVHSWTYGDSGTWSRVVLEPDGSLLVVGSSDGPFEDGHQVDNSRFVMRLSWEGERLWRTSMHAHHDVTRTPEGKLLALDFDYRVIPRTQPPQQFRDDQISLLDPETGEELGRRSVVEILGTRPDLLDLRPLPTMTAGGRSFVDLLHLNALHFLPDLGLEGELYRPGNLLICSRHQDAIAIVNLDSGQLLWAWGPGEISGPHDPSLLDNGNILVFDNGLASQASRVIEVDPRTGQIVWEWKADPPQAFFTFSRGSAQRLANGNTLVADSDQGRAFEVTPDGEVVWEFVNPNLLGPAQRATINRMERLPAELVEPLLEKGR